MCLDWPRTSIQTSRTRGECHSLRLARFGCQIRERTNPPCTTAPALPRHWWFQRRRVRRVRCSTALRRSCFRPEAEQPKRRLRLSLTLYPAQYSVGTPLKATLWVLRQPYSPQLTAPYLQASHPTASEVPISFMRPILQTGELTLSMGVSRRLLRRAHLSIPICRPDTLRTISRILEENCTWSTPTSIQ